MRMFIGLVLGMYVGLFDAFAHAEDRHSIFTAIPIPNDPKSIWVLNVETGSLAFCQALNANSVPLCSPWTAAPTDAPLYRYDLQTKKLVPLNEAARNEHPKFENSN